MDPTRKDKGESLWQQMLESMLTQKTEKVGNLLWCGANKTGKKKLITEIQSLAKHSRGKQKEQDYKSLEKVYIMDFKYVKINKNVGEYNEEHSKLNFYILNKQYEYMKEFLTTDMLSNLIVVILVDLEDPKSIRSTLEEWMTFLKGCIASYVFELNQEKKISIIKSLKDVKQRMRNLTTFSALDDYGYETTPFVATGGIEIPEIDDHTVEDMELEIPFLIIGNKTDVLDKTNDEKLFEHLQYVLREVAHKDGAMVMTTSSNADRNINTLYHAIGNVLVDIKVDDPTIFEPSYNILKMFIPLGLDDITLLNSQIPNADTYVFKDKKAVKDDTKKQVKTDIKDINEFLNEINKGQFVYQENAEGSMAKTDMNRFSMTKNSSKVIDTNLGVPRTSRFADDTLKAKKSNLDKIKSILENR